jgi:hypothetical protein
MGLLTGEMLLVVGTAGEASEDSVRVLLHGGAYV